VLKSANQLRDDVLAALHANPVVGDARFDVVVYNGVVVLTGRLSSYFQKWAAVETVRRVTGVIFVIPRVDIDLPAKRLRGDDEIGRAISYALFWDPCVPASVCASVENGNVSLGGEVAWNYQRRQAEQIVQWTPGVRRITNTIAVRRIVS
jgi:osmotically-inducible protein OsmY